MTVWGTSRASSRVAGWMVVAGSVAACGGGDDAGGGGTGSAPDTGVFSLSGPTQVPDSCTEVIPYASARQIERDGAFSGLRVVGGNALYKTADNLRRVSLGSGGPTELVAETTHDASTLIATRNYFLFLTGEAFDGMDLARLPVGGGALTTRVVADVLDVGQGAYNPLTDSLYGRHEDEATGAVGYYRHDVETGAEESFETDLPRGMNPISVDDWLYFSGSESRLTNPDAAFDLYRIPEGGTMAERLPVESRGGGLLGADASRLYLQAGINYYQLGREGGEAIPVAVATDGLVIDLQVTAPGAVMRVGGPTQRVDEDTIQALGSDGQPRVLLAEDRGDCSFQAIWADEGNLYLIARDDTSWLFTVPWSAP